MDLFIELFLLVCNTKFFEVYDKKIDKFEKIFYSVKMGAKDSLILLFLLVLLTVSTVHVPLPDLIFAFA